MFFFFEKSNFEKWYMWYYLLYHQVLLLEYHWRFQYRKLCMIYRFFGNHLQLSEFIMVVIIVMVVIFSCWFSERLVSKLSDSLNNFCFIVRIRSVQFWFFWLIILSFVYKTRQRHYFHKFIKMMVFHCHIKIYHDYYVFISKTIKVK